ncbi:hypothetical protein PA0402 [Candidatus Phytoplasma australiense]|uniref:DUF2963 domain-containing protein n=2 Tax=Phytoplasma australiense TaxID=59748 RepID=B1V9W4_PHYAS|nr:DUF2963 domain-containing protein [Candidatus Phytoplasma australiense]AGL90950.1 Hypothetical Protein SLY_1036 [Strawberry lethal yellows phytoplasma (CPA) str. NZSb11]CAM11736.1 hypothetical protein PA0402 [Candidatus Phytoplasma australiense]
MNLDNNPKERKIMQFKQFFQKINKDIFLGTILVILLTLIIIKEARSYSNPPQNENNTIKVVVEHNPETHRPTRTIHYRADGKTIASITEYDKENKQ